MKDKDLAMAAGQRSVVLQVTGLLPTKCQSCVFPGNEMWAEIEG